MTVRLAGDVVPGPRQRVRGLGAPADPDRLPPGAPVAVGPRSAGPDVVEAAASELAAVVATGGALVAGAGVDLGAGFRSARTQGGRGDRRDAVLAALALPALGGRLGDRTGVVTALFGPRATKPLGAAAQAALEEGRLPLLRLAVAAADVLGPEQLVRLLELGAPDGGDPFLDGLPSVVGRQLAQILGPVPQPRRLELVADLWRVVCADGVRRGRAQRLRASQRPRSRVDDLLARRTADEETWLRRHHDRDVEPDAPWTHTALWQPPDRYWRERAARVLEDALAATVLARLAVAAVDDGLVAASERYGATVDRVVAQLVPDEVGRPTRRRPALPGRPAVLLREVHARMPPAKPLTAHRERYLRDRLARARDYGRVATEAADDLCYGLSVRGATSYRPAAALVEWAGTSMAWWRRTVTRPGPDRSAGWHQPPLFGAPGAPTLADRIRAEPDRPAAELETIGDLLWYAELGDAIAGLAGHPAAEVRPWPVTPVVDDDPPVPDRPLVPRTELIPLATAGAAQLVQLGGRPPRRCRTWSELVEGLLSSAAVAEALTGGFAVPGEVAATDGAVVPGTDLRVEVAHTRRRLAEWSDHMGNCIATPDYADSAAVGESALVALLGATGQPVVNLQLRPTARGWRIEEIRARFNEDPDPDVLRRARDWAATVPPPAGPTPDLPEVAPPARPRRRRPRPDHDLRERLTEAAAAALADPDVVAAAAVLARLAHQDATDPFGTLVAVRRLSAEGLVRACRSAVADVDLADLWAASAVRPLTRAVRRLPPATAERLAPLLVDAPLSGSLRAPARLPQVAPARTAELVALRTRTAIGALLRADAPELAAAVRRRPPRSLVRAAALAVTSWGGLDGAGAVTVVNPRRRSRLVDLPPSSLRDPEWLAARPDAAELGGRPEALADRIAAAGLLLPSSWLPRGGLPVLWARARA